jgi:protease-4
MSDLAASGGYFISMTGDPIVAYPNTLTGSIGVIYGKVNIAGLYEKIGVTKEILTRGRYAAIDSESVPLDEAGRKKLREAISAMYDAFIDRVAEGRKRKPEDIRPLAEGRVWLGAQAKSNGLIDHLGGLDRAIELVKEKAKIPATDKIRLVIYPRKKTLFEQLFGAGDQSLLEARQRSAIREVSRLLGMDYEQLRVWMPGGFLQIAPYTLRIQ